MIVDQHRPLNVIMRLLLEQVEQSVNYVIDERTRTEESQKYVALVKLSCTVLQSRSRLNTLRPDLHHRAPLRLVSPL